MQATRCGFVFSVVASSSLGLLITGTGCQGLPSSSSTPPATKTLSSLSVSPASATIQTSKTQQFTATAKYSDGSTANVSSSATWSVASSSIASISSGGLATGKASGSTSVMASMSGVNSAATLDVETLKVNKTLTSITIAPLTASIPIGVQQMFTATGTYSDGSSANVTAQATWSVSSSAIATISGGTATGVAAGSTAVIATDSGITGTATITVVPKTVTAISVSPSSADISVGGTQQFTATATYADGTQGNVSSSAVWSVADASDATVNSSGLVIGLAQGDTNVAASFSGFSSSAVLDVSNATITGVNIPTFHVDRNRSGLNAGETLLTPSNVTASSFGKLFSYLVDGYVYGQPLLISNLTMSDGATHNVLFAATENDSVYAFDADSYGTGAPLWMTPLLQGGETPITNGPIQPVEGVTSTPAIDTTTNTMYVVSAQTSSAAGGTFRLNALDITTGTQKPGSPIQITAQVAGTNDTTLGTDCLQRAALLVLPGTQASVFIGFGSCHSGWLLAYTYDGTTFTQSGVFNSSPNLQGEGLYASAGGVWMGGGGPVSDGNYVYITTGNGPWDGQTAFSDSVLKFTQTLQLIDYFTPYDYEYMDCADADLAAGGLLLIPGSTQAIAGGKTGKLYMVNTDDLGHEQANNAGATYTNWFDDLLSPYPKSCTDPQGNVWTTDVNEYEIFGTSAYFNGSFYLGITPTSTSVTASVGQFIFSGTAFSYGGYTQPNILESSYGTTPFISANGASNGILWMIDHGQPLQSGTTQTNATLRAYTANNLSAAELYDSSANSGDAPGYGIKFSAPIAANGKVYISTGHDLVTAPNPQGELDVYGLK
jgi:Bacterial Ig-like domain (group 2)